MFVFTSSEFDVAHGEGVVGRSTLDSCSGVAGIPMPFPMTSPNAPSTRSSDSRSRCPPETLHHSMSARTLLLLVSEPDDRLCPWP